MKKSAALLTSAALALTLMTSNAALAGSAKTVSDYKDLADADAGLKTKIELLLSQGIMEGVSDDSFGIAETMTRAQFAKVASLIFKLQVDMSLKTSSFTDVKADDPANGWAIPYIEAARAAGLVDGVSDTTFAPGDPVTVGQLDTLLLRGLGQQVDVSSTPWYANAVKQAAQLGIHPADKGGDANADRADLVTSAYAASMNSTPAEQQDQVSVAAVSANGDQAVLVKLDGAVDSAAKLSLTKDGAAVESTIAWASDRKSAIITLTGDTKLTNGVYTITLSGLKASAIKNGSRTLTIGTPGPSEQTGDLIYSIPATYELKDVIDSKLTGLATGTNGYASQSEAENPTTSMFAKEVVIKVTTTSGEEAAVGGLIQSISSSNPSVVKAAVSSDHKGYILGNKAGSATINIVYTVGSSQKQMSIPVEVKSSPLSAEKIEARDPGFYTYASVTNGVYAAQFDAFEMMDLLVTDSYGIEYEKDEIKAYNFALNTMFIPEDIVGDPAAGPVGSVTVDTDGTVHVAGNVTEFTLTAMLPNDLRALSEVHVRKQAE